MEDKTVVKYSAKFVRNMGNFESLHLEIGVEDGKRGDETAAEAYNRIKDFVESRLLDEVDQVEKDIREMKAS